MKFYNKLFLLALSLMAGGQISNGQTYTFAYTGAVQTWTVPPGVTSIYVQAQGAVGGQNSIESFTGCTGSLPDRAGYGGCVKCSLAVVPGQVLNIYVGQKGLDGTRVGCASGTGGAGGWNGGGNGQYAYGGYAGGGGGGASDIRIGGVALSNRVIVAAGGGGAGGNYFFSTDYERGGDGGGLTGEAGYGDNTAGGAVFGGGGGGTSAAGGAGGMLSPYAAGSPGTLGTGGAGATGATSTDGGGGGGGYYGGGGGCWGGGGGGSNYTDPVLATAVIHTRGCNTATDGSVVICAANPGVISGPSSVCAGQTITLATTGTGGTWSSSNTAAATVAGGIVGGVAAGVATISYIVTTTCGNFYSVYNIVVNPAPTPIAGPANLCAGLFYVLTSTPAGGTWVSSNPAAATITTSGTISAIAAGSTNVTYTLPSGCYATAVENVQGIIGPSKVCVDSSITLVVPGGGGTWVSGDATIAAVGSASGIVTGMFVGTTTISYTGTSCAALTHTVMVGASAPIAGRDSVCVGGTGYLTNIVGGGTWFSSNPAVASISFDSGLVYGFVPGFDTIVYHFPAGCMVSQKISIIGPPPASMGGLSACAEGGSTVLANSTGGGVWSSSNTSIATVNPMTGVVTGVAPDTVGILYTIQPGCSNRTVVTIDPLPERITGRDTVCPGIVDTLHDVSPAGSWINGTPSLITSIDTFGITKFVAGHTGGVATITYKLPVTGCQRTTTVYVYPGPNPTVTYAFWLNTFYAPTGWAGYQWYDSTQRLIPGANSVSLAATHTDYYWVVVTDSLGCKGASGISQFNIAELSVSNVAGNQVKIYPNPTTGAIRIESPERVKAVISDMAGRVTMEQENATEMDLGRLANGVYMITLYDASGQRVSVQKLTKE